MDAVDAGDDVGVAGTDLHGYMDADADDTDRYRDTESGRRCS